MRSLRGQLTGSGELKAGLNPLGVQFFEIHTPFIAI